MITKARVSGAVELPGTLTELAADLARQHPELPEPITRRWSECPVVCLDDRTPWLYGPAARDPLLGGPGPAVLPRAPRRQLRRVAAAGFRFPALAVAHELDPTGAVRALLPLLQEGPRTCTDEVARALVGPTPAHPALRRVAVLPDRLLGRAAGRLVEALLDPIVFGVVAPGPLSHGTACLWYPLTAWRW